MAAVAKGPVSVTVWAGPLQNYRGGIMAAQCMPYQHGDHAMLVVGYGTANGTDYWKIKNSYGPVRMPRARARARAHMSIVCGYAMHIHTHA